MHVLGALSVVILLLAAPHVLAEGQAHVELRAQISGGNISLTVDPYDSTTTQAAATTSQSTAAVSQLSTLSATSEASTTASLTTAVATGDTTATSTLSSTTSLSATTSSSASTSLTEASSIAAAAGPTATSSFVSSTASTTSTTAASVATSLASTTGTTSAAVTTSLLATEAITASSLTTSTATTASNVNDLPTSVVASATASVGFTTFSATTSSGGATTSPTIPPSTCASGSSCCQGEAPVSGSYCAGTGHYYDGDLSVNKGEIVGVTEPFTVEGSMLLSPGIFQISSPTVIKGNFTLTADSVLSLTQVPGLTVPLLTVLGSTFLLGTVVFNSHPNVDLIQPLMAVQEDTVLSGAIVPTINGAFPSKVPLLFSDRVIASDPDGDGVTINFVVVLNKRPGSSRKRADPQVILCFNTTTALSVPVDSTSIVVSPRYTGNECDSLTAPAQAQGSSLSMLVSVSRSKCKGGLSRGALAGIVVGAVVAAAALVLLGILAVKKGLFRRLFNAKQDDSFVV